MHVISIQACCFSTQGLPLTSNFQMSKERDCWSFQIFVTALFLISSGPKSRVWTKQLSGHGFVFCLSNICRCDNAFNNFGNYHGSPRIGRISLNFPELRTYLRRFPILKVFKCFNFLFYVIWRFLSSKGKCFLCSHDHLLLIPAISRSFSRWFF